MTILIGNAPCSWGVEFANDERNPAWTTVLDECAEAGYRGIELGPVGFMPEDPDVLGPALESRNLALIGGVVFRAFHDPEKWEDTLDGSVRTCKALKAHGAKHLVLIDSISDRRAPTAGRPEEAEQMDDAGMGRVRRTHPHDCQDGDGRVRTDRGDPCPCRWFLRLQTRTGTSIDRSG